MFVRTIGITIAIFFKGFIAFLLGGGYAESVKLHILSYWIMIRLIHTKTIFLACQARIAIN